jgi:DNA-binding NarL/FixJ family response regulator
MTETASKRARILVADDHSIILAGIRSLVEQDCELVGGVGDGRSLVQAALDLRPDLIILDIGMPILNGIDAARQIRTAWPEAKFLFLTMHTNPIYLREAMRAGASGYVLKTSAAEELRVAIQTVLKGKVFVSARFGPDVLDFLLTPSGRRSMSNTNLTGRQREVLQLVAEGRTNAEIATILKVSVKTVQFHRGQIMRKLGVHSAVKLTAFAVREGMVNE